MEQSDSRPPLPAPPVAVLVDGDVNLSDDQELANRAAMLLESALGDKPAEINNEVEGSKRKPLSDIGNKVVSLTFIFFYSIYFSKILHRSRL